MLKFVLLCSGKKDARGYELIVDKLLMKEETEYKCYNYSFLGDDLHDFIKEKYDDMIYIIEESEEVSSLEIIETLRNSYNDFKSFVIIIDKENKLSRSYIEENYFVHAKVVNDVRKLANALEKVIKAFESKKSKLSYQYNGAFYNIEFSRILYIEKQLDSKICNVICLDKTYYINSSVKNMKKVLNNDFVQTHQSAIINLNNVLSIDFNSKVIEFINGDQTNLFSRNYKKSVKEVITKKFQKVTE